MGSLVGGFFPLIATSLYAWTGRPGHDVSLLSLCCAP